MTKAKVLSPALILLAGIALLGCSETGASGSDPEEQTQSNVENNTGVNILTSVFPSPKEQIGEVQVIEVKGYRTRNRLAE